MNFIGTLLRLLPSLIIIFASIFIRMSKGNKNNLGYNSNYNTTESLMDKAESASRRSSALFSCAQFLKIRNNVYTLKNDYIKLIFDSNTNVIICSDLKNKERTLILEREKQTMYLSQNFANISGEFFDYICFNFNENVTYDSLTGLFKTYFNVVETISERDNAKAENTSSIKKSDENIEKLNINSASAEEIAKLPGISIILAKKIVKYRNKIGSFKTENDFFTVTRLKPHFQFIIHDLIYIGEKENKTEQIENTGRIIDF